MRQLNILSMSAISLLVSVSALSMTAPAKADDAKFLCGTSKGAPATMAQTARGPIPVIRWVSSAFAGAGYSPQYRCQVVSSKFQQYYKDGKLNYLTTGVANHQPVVCVASTKGGPCSGVLFTLKSGSDPWLTLTRLMSVRVSASAPPLNESSAGDSSSQYIDMNEYLNTAPVESPAARSVTPTETQSRAVDPVPATALW